MPLRSATTLFGRPALISDCAPMMLRVRPAQLTTTSVSGEGAMSWMRSTSSAPGTLVAVGIDTRWNSSNGRLSTTTMSVPRSQQRGELVGGDARRAGGVLDVLAERLARHVDAGEQFEACLLPAGDAALQEKQIVVAGARKDRGGALDQAVASSQSTMRVARRGTSRANRSSSRLSGIERAHNR